MTNRTPPLGPRPRCCGHRRAINGSDLRVAEALCGHSGGALSGSGRADLLPGFLPGGVRRSVTDRSPKAWARIRPFVPAAADRHHRAARSARPVPRPVHRRAGVRRRVRHRSRRVGHHRGAAAAGRLLPRRRRRDRRHDPRPGPGEGQDIRPPTSHRGGVLEEARGRLADHVVAATSAGRVRNPTRRGREGREDRRNTCRCGWCG
jgi:hypothetical protein